MTRRLVVLALFGLAACATVNRGIDTGASAAANVLVPPESEAQLGQKLAAQVNSQEKIDPDSTLQAYVSRVGQKVLASVPKKDLHEQKFTFQVIDKPKEVNAFAIPGGHIYVYSGLIAAADDEAELAGVLAHEIGHGTARHGAEMLVKQLGLETVMGLALGKNPNQLAALGSQIAAQGYLAQNSQDQEREADSRGLRYLTSAGYNPNALPDFFDKLNRMSGSRPDAISKFFASHPQPGERAKTARATIAKSGKRTGKTEIVGGFAQMKARVSGASTGPSAPSRTTPSAPSGTTPSTPKGSTTTHPAPSGERPAAKPH
jgi:predicted Zn-dependent protease